MSMYSPNKAAQMAAVFAHKQGGVINVLKLTKLLYLADRESLTKYGYPISYDRMVSMDHGPVLSRTLDLTNGFVNGPAAAKWDEWIGSRTGHDVSLKRDFSRDDLNELSAADMEVLEAVWHKFGEMDEWTLREWTHKNCPEWNNPNGSSLPIDEVVLLESVGVAKERAQALANTIKAERDFDALFVRLR